MSERENNGVGSKHSPDLCQVEHARAGDVNFATEKMQEQIERPGDQTGRLAPEAEHISSADLHRLGKTHQERFKRYGNLKDIKKAIDYGTRSVESTPENHPELPRRFDDLGASYRHLYERLSDTEDIEKAIKYGLRAVALAHDGHPDLPTCLNTLGLSYTTRSQHRTDPGDLEKAISYGTRVLSMIADGHPELTTCLANLALGYYVRSQYLGELGDTKKAVEYGTRSVSLTPQGHSELPFRVGLLGMCYWLGFMRSGELGDLAKAIEHISHGLELTPDDHPELHLHLTDLGLALTYRFQRMGEQEDLNKAIEYKSRAVDVTPDGHRFLPVHIGNLGTAYYLRYGRAGELGDLDRAIEYITRALSLLASGDTQLPGCLQILGSVHLDRFRRVGALDDLERGIEYQTRALALTPDTHPDLPNRLSSLGVSYLARFERQGELNDLEQGIEFTSRGLKLAPDGHPFLPEWLSNIGSAYSLRFQRLGDLDDLEKGVEYQSRAFNLTPHDHPQLRSRLSNLGISHHNRFRRIGQMDDLNKAIRYGTRAFNSTPSDNPALPFRLSEVGVYYSDRFVRLGELDDLEKAIELLSRAYASTPKGHPHLPTLLFKLGVAYQLRFRRLNELSDLEKAIEHTSRGLGGIPEGHPLLTTGHHNLAQYTFLQFQCSNNPSHLTDCLEHFRKGTLFPTASPRDKFRCALEWAEVASTHLSLNCMEAYLTAINLLPQFIWLGATTNQRYYDLSTAGGLAINAAAAASLQSSHAIALEWLEHARCVVWSQSLMLRSPLDQLHSSHPELGIRLRNVALQLQDTGSDLTVRQSSSAGSDNAEQTGRQRRRLAQEYESLLAEARTLPGLERFLQPVDATALLRAALNGPVIVINCHKRRCDALLIIPGQDHVSHLPLPEYDQGKAQKARSILEFALRSKGLRQRGFKPRLGPEHKNGFATTLLDLWKYVVKPILAFLGLTDNIPADNPPHITWCPTGMMTFLPLHAAGDYNQPRSRVFDYAMSSYTPTLSALLSSTPTVLTPTSRVLAIGQANTPGQSPLPGTTGELECVKGHIQSKFEYAELTGSRATVASVLDAMEEHDWVHLACHAHQNVDDPTKSGFYLHDGTLDLAAINRRSFKNKGLAFLSACQTATGDEKLPDEAIHLASGMLMAGYPSVIATLWSVMDDDAPFIADKVYAELMKEGKVGNGQAGKALHLAVATLREKVGEKEFGRWVPYIHIGS